VWIELSGEGRARWKAMFVGAVGLSFTVDPNGERPDHQ
jgi:hypothetical protein